MANEAEIIASNILSSAIEYKRLYDTTKKIEYREKEQRLRRIAENIKLFTGSNSTSTVSSFNGRTGAVILNSTDVIGALGYTPGDMLKSVYDYDNDGVVDSAERTEIIVRNSTGSTLTKGTVVYLSGATGNRPNAIRSQANSEATSSKTFGFVVSDIANNADGYVACAGTLHDLDTSAFADGVALWLSPTVAGGWTTTVPSEPNHSVFLGYVARSHPTQGRVVILIQNGYELNELHDVVITSPSNNQILRYNSTNAYWENWTPTYLTGVPTLDQVTTAGNTTTNAITVGGLTVDTDTLYVDATNNRVGIGTTSPGFNLDIYGATLNNPYIRLRTNAAASGGNYANGIIFDRTSGGATNNIGIFTDPSRGHTTNADALTFSLINSPYTRLFTIQQNAGLVLGSYAGVNTAPVGGFIISGNVGIGTPTDAGYKLDVNGTARVSGNVTLSGSGTQLIDITGGAYAIGKNTSTLLDGITSAAYGLGFSSTKFNISGYYGIKFFTSNTERLSLQDTDFFIRNRLTTTGSITASSAIARGVYFNNTLVAAANNDVLVGLDIAPTFTNGSFTGVNDIGLRVLGDNVGGSSAYSIYAYGGQAYFRGNFSNNTGFSLLVQNRSNVTSFGVRGDGVALAVGGVSVSDGTNKGLDISYSGVGGYKMSIAVSDTGVSFSNTAGASRPVSFSMNTGEILRIHQSYTSIVTNNFLIGTTTDAGYKLDVNGTVRLKDRLVIDSGSTLDYPITLTTSKTGNNGTVYLANTSSTGQVLMVFHNEVGGNYSYNSYGLLLYGGSGAGDPLFGANRQNRFMIAADGASNLGMYLGTLSAQPLVFGTNNVERIRINSSGSVGIGTTSPSYKLQVVGDIALSGNLVPTAGSQTLGTFTNRFGDVWAGGLIVGTTFYGDNYQTASGTMFFKDGGGVERMRMTSVGNFLIGTTTDSGYKLDVNGTARVQGAFTATLANVSTANVVYYNSSTGLMTYGAAPGGGGGGTLDTVTTAGNTTSNSISVGGLTVSNSAVPIATFDSSNGGGTYLAIKYGGSLKAAWGMSGNIIGGLSINDVGFWSSNAMAWEAGGALRMFLTAGGNLLINTISDNGNRLQVNGTIDGQSFAAAGVNGWTGTINCPTNPPGQQNIQVSTGIIVNVF